MSCRLQHLFLVTLLFVSHHQTYANSTYFNLKHSVDHLEECTRNADCFSYTDPGTCIHGYCYPVAHYQEICIYDEQCEFSHAVCNFLTTRCTCHYEYKWKSDNGIGSCIPENQCVSDDECLETKKCNGNGYCVPKTLMSPLRITISSIVIIILVTAISIGVCCCRRRIRRDIRRDIPRSDSQTQLIWEHG